MKVAIQNCVTEWAFASGQTYADPFNEVELDVLFTDPDGEERRVPAFWGGENLWRVRYASQKVGPHRYRTECSDASNADLHGQEGELEVRPYEGDNPLFKHGPLRISGNRRYLEHLDGTPFFWLGDTWWMGLCHRLRWPGEFQQLTADRVTKGFSVIQIIAGLYPDMPPFDERGANEAGFPWEPDYARINPAYFDMADLRIDYLVRNGLVPCVVGCWGYFLKFMGLEKMKQHWRYLVSRWGAHPVVWCLGGEANMPYYLSEQRDEDGVLQVKGWTEMGRYMRQIDPYGHPVTNHPIDSGRGTVEDPTVLDFEMLQTGHSDRRSVPKTVEMVTESYASEPRMPVIDGEVCYEGIGEACRQEVQRMVFWASVLSGACGHTYGANGIWQVNRREQPYGPSPHGMSYGPTPWDEAAQLPGSAHLGVAKRLLERYEWWRFEPHPEWIEPHWTTEEYILPYAGGIPGEVRVIFIPLCPWPETVKPKTVKGIEPDASYRAFLFDPTNADEVDLGDVNPDANSDWLMLGAYPEVIHRWLGHARRISACMLTVVAERPDSRGRGKARVEIPDSLAIIGEMESGAQLRVVMSGVVHGAPHDTLEIHGDRGTLVYDFSDNAIRVAGGSESWQRIPIPPEEEDTWTVEEDLVAAVRGVGSVHPDFHDGYKYMEFVEAAWLSHGQRRHVDLPIKL